jgi:hypothetical protein
MKKNTLKHPYWNYSRYALLPTCTKSRQSKYTALQSGYFDYKYAAVNYQLDKRLVWICITQFITYTLSWIFIVLVNWNNCLQVDMLLHSDTLSWFRVNQSLLLHVAFLAAMPHIPVA